MRRPNEPQVVVITGASSGIGRLTALAFAERGAAVVLAARRGEVLAEVAEQCVAIGGQAIAVPTDVGDADAVAAVARRAVEHFGRIDLWFNNAGVGVFGKLNAIPVAVWHRVIATNLLGAYHGARAVMPVFDRQGHGILINNASIVGRIAKPDSTAYATSKFAIRGLSEALRQELLDRPNIHVCTILPSVIDTPFFEHAANYSGQRVRAAPPVYPPERVVDAVLKLARRPVAETIIGGAGKFAAAQKRIAPALTTRMTGRLLHRGFLETQPAEDGPGATLEPVRDGRGVTGGWRRLSGPLERSRPSPIMLGLLALPILAVATRWMMRPDAGPSQGSHGDR
ncbi:MAG TPA: SDR family oxidoreductase [Sphingomonas sp.]|uniref:SDR family oxidoreductase n=1 Tax=Sphingomonas sp. TaxID=28214 RepID=UPI002EDA1D93